MLTLLRVNEDHYVLILEREFIHGTRKGIEKKLSLIGIASEQIQHLFRAIMDFDRTEDGQEIDICVFDEQQLLSQGR